MSGRCDGGRSLSRVQGPVGSPTRTDRSTTRQARRRTVVRARGARPPGVGTTPGSGSRTTVLPARRDGHVLVPFLPWRQLTLPVRKRSAPASPLRQSPVGGGSSLPRTGGPAWVAGWSSAVSISIFLRDQVLGVGSPPLTTTTVVSDGASGLVRPCSLGWRSQM